MVSVMIDCQEKGGLLSFHVRVTARASSSECVGEHDGALRVRVAAAPVDGAANEELIRLLAGTFGLPKAAVEITAGHSSKLKQVRIRGAKKSDLLKLIN
jgi:uncharacterized protein